MKFWRSSVHFLLLSGAPCDITLLNFHTSLNVNYRQKIEMGTAIYLISPKWPFDVFICIILCKSELDKSLSSKVRPNSTLLISIIGSKFLISSPSASTFSPCKTWKYSFVCLAFRHLPELDYCDVQQNVLFFFDKNNFHFFSCLFPSEIIISKKKLRTYR